MIVRQRPTFFDICFALRGSILPAIIRRVLAIGGIACLAVWLSDKHPRIVGPMEAVPFTLIGIALSIFLSFRNNACYDRWWEGRKLWGQLVVEARSFARAVAPLDITTRGPMLRCVIGFAHGLAARLRNGREAETVARFTTTFDTTVTPNPTDAILREVGERCAALARGGTISDIDRTVLEARLTALSYVQAGCERIVTTPLPYAYSLLLHRTAYLFCALLPFALAGKLGWWTPLVAVVVCYTFFGLDALGDELENPFGPEPNDLPLDAIVRLIERELLAAAGERDLPHMLQPVDGLLV